MNPPSDTLELDRTRDPVEWAILSFVVGAAGLLLALEAKIENRRKAESAASAAKARSGNRLRVRNLKTQVAVLAGFTRSIREHGSPVVDLEKPPPQRVSLIFKSAESEEAFNDEFSRALAAVDRINRELGLLDPEGFTLSSNDIELYVRTPTAQAVGKTVKTLRLQLGPNERLRQVQDLLQHYADLLANLEIALAG